MFTLNVVHSAPSSPTMAPSSPPMATPPPMSLPSASCTTDSNTSHASAHAPPSTLDGSCPQDVPISYATVVLSDRLTYCDC